MSPAEHRALIDGALVEADSGAMLPNVNPATEEVIGEVVEAGTSDMERAIDAARRAFDGTSWREDAAFRQHCLGQLRSALVDHLEELREQIVAEVGCPISLTRGVQLDWQLPMLEWWERLAVEYPYETWPDDVTGSGKRRMIRREPIGVVGAITAYNVPLQLIVAKLGPALGAGNTVVLKPAPQTPWTATFLARLIAEHTDFPPGVVNIVPSSDAAVAERLTTDPRVNMIAFTGSTAVGRRIMERAAGTVKRLFLELGGKSPYIVCDDVDVERHAMGAVLGIAPHAGQGCGRTTRLLVPRDGYDRAVDAAREAMATIRYGDPQDPENVMGPLISEEQRRRVLGHIKGAADEGATISYGGGVPSDQPRGYFVEPTLITDVGPEHRIAQDEIFGPVLCVLPYDSDDHAVEIANATIFGLAGVIASASEDRALAIARRVKSGVLILNGGAFYGPDSPFGGTKQSGIGREMGVIGFEEYLDVKNIALPATSD